MPTIVEVSILVLMDFRLKGLPFPFTEKGMGGFNPCSNGLSAQRHVSKIMHLIRERVSILVLMDFRLKDVVVVYRYLFQWWFQSLF